MERGRGQGRWWREQAPQLPVRGGEVLEVEKQLEELVGLPGLWV